MIGFGVGWFFPLAQFFSEGGAEFFGRVVEDHGFADDSFEQGFETPPAFFAGKNLALVRDEDAASGTGLEQAFTGKVGIGAGDGVWVDDKLLGEGADAGELVTDGDLAGGDGHANLIGDLFIDRSGGTDIKIEGQRLHYCISYTSTVWAASIGILKEMMNLYGLATNQVELRGEKEVLMGVEAENGGIRRGRIGSGRAGGRGR